MTDTILDDPIVISLSAKRPYYENWWRGRVRKYTFNRGQKVLFAKAPIGPDSNPPSVNHLFSAVFEPGVRVFAFRTHAARKDFLNNVPGARVCEDPAP